MRQSSGERARGGLGRGTRRLIRACGLALGLAACALGSRALAQTSINPLLPDPTPVQSDAPDLTGREFAGLRLGASRQTGDVVIAASRAFAWSEGGAANVLGPDGVPIGTQRLVLVGDVRIELGGYRFTASQATIWSQVLEVPAGATAGPEGETERRVRQWAIHFDRVSDPGSQAGFAQAADRLLVTAVMDGGVTLITDSITPGRPATGTPANFLRESEVRFARYLRGVSTQGTQASEGQPKDAPITPAVTEGVVRGVPRPGRGRPYEPNSPIARAARAGEADLPETREVPISERVDPLFARSGVITFAAGTRAPGSATAPRTGETAADTEFIKLLRGEQENTLLISGGVVVQYSDYRKTRNLVITAERAVVFLPAGPLTDLGRFGADQVRGVYLEGDVVATDGQYTLRGPRVYYDIAENKAVMADAVFSTVDPKTGMPIYVRAATLRQEAANQVTAEKARLSTSSFFEPVLSVGAGTITVTQAPRSTQGGPQRVFVDASNFTLRLGGLPVFWLPGFKGEIEDIPLEDVRFTNSSSSGGAIQTTWRLFGLLGVDKPEGINVKLLLDYYFDRGPGIGTQADWSKNGVTGSVLAYTLPNDDGRDQLLTGAKKDQDNEFRGLVTAENRWEITKNWTLFAEGSYISDETFVDAFFRDIGQTGREVTSSVNLRYLEGNQYLSVMARGSFNDFTPNQYLLESQGYMVRKLPEARYARLADDVLPGVEPGLLTWTHEYRASRQSLNFNEPLARDFGFTTPFLSQKAFGINPDQSLAQVLRSGGLSERAVARGDTRQELTAVLDFNPFRITPFVVGRFTGYDQKIEKFDAFSPDGGDQYRLWYAGGVRASTQIVRVDDAAESSLLDLHRTRHIIEPSVTAWSAGSSIRQESLPIYDYDVESLNTGTAVRTGVTQIWQTQRGGPGRWRSVDVLRLSTDVVFSTKDINKTSDIGRFFDSRPEYSVLGNYFNLDAAWQASEVVGLTATTIYDFDASQSQRTTAGFIVQHSPEFATYAQLRFINPLDTTYVDFGFNYQLTRLYSLQSNFVYDTDKNELQDVGVQVLRRMPDSLIGVKVRYNQITEETSVGVIVQPQALAEKENKLQRLRNIKR